MAMSLGAEDDLEPSGHWSLSPREGQGFGGMLDSRLPLLSLPAFR